MKAIIDALTSKEVVKIADQIEKAIKGVPHLPKSIVDFLVKVAPWLSLVGGFFGVISALGSLNTAMGWRANAWLRMAGLSNSYFWVMGIFSLIMAVIMLMAFQPLKAKEEAGWTLMFVNFGVSLLQSIVLMILFSLTGSVLMTVIMLALGIYVLFELRPSYQK